MNEPLVLAAEELAAELVSSAIWDRRMCTWIGPFDDWSDGSSRVIFKTLDYDLYSGTSGVCLALAELYHATGDEVFKLVSLGAARHALRRMQTGPRQRLGYFRGWPGAMIAILRSANLLSDPELGRQAFSTVTALQSTSLPNTSIDVIGGSAGAILALKDLSKYGGSSRRCLDLAMAEGDRIISASTRAGDNWSWRTLGITQGNLCGYAHGASGIGLALAELASWSGDERYLGAVEGAFRYEDEQFSYVEKNWPDLRPWMPGVNGNAGYQLGWCHGAAGGIMVRLRMSELGSIGPDSAVDHMALALELCLLTATSPSSFADWSTCHGMSGVGEALLYASSVLCRPEFHLIATAALEARFVSKPTPRYRVRSGISSGAPCPGLMLGAAGHIHHLLRVSNPTVASILVLGSRDEPDGCPDG